MMSDRIFAGIWLLLCIAGLFVAWQISSEYSYEPVGPRPFPLGIISHRHRHSHRGDWHAVRRNHPGCGYFRRGARHSAVVCL